MPVPVFRMTVISRGGGRSAVASAAYGSGSKLTSAVASAAYRSGETLHDDRVNQTFNYTRKEDILHTEIMTPDKVPEWAQHRETLWNRVEAGEARKDAQLARSLIAALPRELDMEQNLQFAREFVQAQFVSKGMIADVAIHDKDASDGGNQPHMHVMLTMREIDQHGFSARKNRDWNSKEQLESWRTAWGEMQNRYLSEAGVEARVSMDSYAKRGINKQPQEHVGAKNWKKEQQGIATPMGDKNREIRQANEVNEAIHHWQPEYTEADVATYYATLQRELVSVYEPDRASIQTSAAQRTKEVQAESAQRLYYASLMTTTEWFGLGGKTSRMHLPGMTGLSRSVREKLEHTRQDLNIDAGLEYHRSTVAGFLHADRSGASTEGVEQFQRMVHFVKDTVEEISHSILNQYASWTERQQGWDPQPERGSSRDE